MFRYGFILTVICCALLAPVRAFAAGSSGQADAVVLVLPVGDMLQVTAVYPTVVPRAEAEKRVNLLAAKSGWRVIEAKTHDDRVSAGTGSVTRTVTDVSFGAAALVNQGGFQLQPFVEAFADLNRIDLLIMVAPFTGFQGLHDYEGSALSVHLTTPGKPFWYTVAYHGHGAPLPTLPLTQEPAGGGAAAAESHKERGSLLYALAPVVVGAAASGLIVMFLLYLRGRRRGVRPVA